MRIDPKNLKQQESYHLLTDFVVPRTYSLGFDGKRYGNIQSFAVFRLCDGEYEPDVGLLCHWDNKGWTKEGYYIEY